MTGADEIERSLSVLRGEIERLDSIGLNFAASLVRIAEIELRVRLHNLSEEDIDALTLAANTVQQERHVRRTRIQKRGTA